MFDCKIKVPLFRPSNSSKFLCDPNSIFFSYSEIEPLANDCTEILVWHTMTAAPVAKVKNKEGIFRVL